MISALFEVDYKLVKHEEALSFMLVLNLFIIYLLKNPKDCYNHTTNSINKLWVLGEYTYVNNHLKLNSSSLPFILRFLPVKVVKPSNSWSIIYLLLDKFLHRSRRGFTSPYELGGSGKQWTNPRFFRYLRGWHWEMFLLSIMFLTY